MDRVFAMGVGDGRSEPTLHVMLLGVLLVVLCGRQAEAQPARLSLRTATSQQQAQVGDTLEIQVFIEPRGASLTSVSAYVSFDERVFTLLPDQTLGDGTVLPFRSGGFMRGQVYANSTAGDTIGSHVGNGLDGFQLDYVAVSGSGFGGDRQVSVEPGVLASFQLAVVGSESNMARIELDDSGRRRSIYTEVGRPGVEVDFQTPLAPLQLMVSGEGRPVEDFRSSPAGTDLLLAERELTLTEDAGEVLISLEEFLASGVRLEGATWTATTSGRLSFDFSEQNLIVRVPPDWHGTEEIALTVVDGEGRSDTVAISIEVLPVNDPPVVAEIKTQVVASGGTIRGPALEDLITDVDDPLDRLAIAFETSGVVEVEQRRGYLWLSGLQPGTGEVAVSVVDAAGARGTGLFEVRVISLSGAPALGGLPLVELERGAAIELRLNEYVADDDTPPEQLRWSVAARGPVTAELMLEVEGPVLRIVAVASGTGLVALQVSDPDGNSAAGAIAVEVAAVKLVATDRTLVLGEESMGGVGAPVVYPNPFNSQAAIEYQLAEDAWVQLIIYDELGRRVRTLIDNGQIAGHQTAVWAGRGENGRDLSSGIYFYQIRTNRHRWSGKMMLVR